jgi:hypothetical protein
VRFGLLPFHNTKGKFHVPSPTAWEIKKVIYPHNFSKLPGILIQFCVHRALGFCFGTHPLGSLLKLCEFRSFYVLNGMKNVIY